jgi:hypothetical protein
MYKNFNLTDEERKQILESHSSHGYKKPMKDRLPFRLAEEKLSSMINESMAQTAIADAESKMSGGETPDPNVVNQIKQCITKKQLTSLSFLTTAAGSYALGVVALLTMSGVGAAAGGVLAIASIIVIFITGLSEKDGGLGSDPSKDVKSLLSCMGM